MRRLMQGLMRRLIHSSSIPLQFGEEKQRKKHGARGGYNRGVNLARVCLVLCLVLGMVWRSSAQALTVFAASSLSDAFGEIGTQFGKTSNVKVDFQFAGSQILRTQLENGAKADVYASASRSMFDPLVTAKLLQTGSIFARNRLVVLVSEPAKNQLKTLRDLAKPGVKLIIADKNVPAGQYTQNLLERLSKAPQYGPTFGNKVLQNVISEESNVRQVALKVVLGEADAGIVYSSDGVALQQKVKILKIPVQYNPLAEYPIGILNSSSDPSQAKAFVDFVRGPVGQKILQKWGFIPAKL
jgi:molybdate transport system substrate-binding protein